VHVMRTKQREKDAAITRIAHSAVAEHETDRFSMLLTRGGTLVVDGSHPPRRPSRFSPFLSRSRPPTGVMHGQPDAHPPGALA
jgi:hypothetical protein